MTKEEKIIRYDSPEAAKQVTITGWVDSGGRFWGKDEHMARWSGCTHVKCSECDNWCKKSYTKCDECIQKGRRERFLSLPFKEWDLVEAVCLPDGDEYFFDLETLEDYMEEQEMQEIDLLFCDEIGYHHIHHDHWSDDMPDNVEDIPDELKIKIKEFNKFLDSLGTLSYYPGKIRTSYKIQRENEIPD